MLTAPLSLLLSAALAQNPARPAESGRWASLFDGATAEGWLEVTGKPFPAASWRVEDRCLRAIASPGGGMQDIRTRIEFGKAYELQFEWKVAPGGNSGVKYLVQRVDEWTSAAGRQARARGFEYQLSDDAGEPPRDPRKISGALYESIAPAKAASRPAGQFNHSTIRVADGRAQHWLNGVKVVDCALDSEEAKAAIARAKGKDPKAAGAPGNFISLQNHGTPAWFRNLKIRVLANESGAE